MSEVFENNKSENIVFISVDKGLDEIRRKNLHLTVGLLSFTTMLFHFSTVYFFTLQLKSIALVGVFLGLGNLFAFLFDIPVGILQYHLKSKTLYILGVLAQIVAMFIFGNFIFDTTNYISSTVLNSSGGNIIEDVLSFFLQDFLNIVLLLIAAICYGFNKEVNDITTISYVLNNASPHQYKDIIAKNNLFFGIGSFLGLLISGFILTFSPKLVIIYILFIILIVFFLAFKFFDNSTETINLKDVKKFKVYFDKGGLGKFKADFEKKVSNIDLKTVVKGTKYIFLKPKELKKSGLSSNYMISEAKAKIIDIFETLKFAGTNSLIVYWSVIMVLIFGFWDTFASTFLIDFLDKLAHGYSYILLGIIAIPAFGLQGFFGNLADKVGVYKIANIGLLLSGISLFIMGFFSGKDANIFLILALALINSIGYAICMSLSVAVFLESYNKVYANKKNLKEIDSNASAAPMKILQNLANVFGLFMGSIILGILGYAGFFFAFGIIIILYFIWSLKKKAKVEKGSF